MLALAISTLCQSTDLKKFIDCSVLEIFSWLIEVENVTKENRDNGKIKWSVNYVQDVTRTSQNYSSEVFSAAPENSGRRQRVIARFQIMKDDIQSILPIAKVNLSNLMQRMCASISLFCS